MLHPQYNELVALLPHFRLATNLAHAALLRAEQNREEALLEAQDTIYLAKDSYEKHLEILDRTFARDPKSALHVSDTVDTLRATFTEKQKTLPALAEKEHVGPLTYAQDELSNAQGRVVRVAILKADTPRREVAMGLMQQVCLLFEALRVQYQREGADRRTMTILDQTLHKIKEHYDATLNRRELKGSLDYFARAEHTLKQFQEYGRKHLNHPAPNTKPKTRGKKKEKPKSIIVPEHLKTLETGFEILNDNMLSYWLQVYDEDGGEIQDPEIQDFPYTDHTEFQRQMGQRALYIITEFELLETLTDTLTSFFMSLVQKTSTGVFA